VTFAVLAIVVLLLVYCIAGTSDWQIEQNGQRELAAAIEAEVARAAQTD
jgi:hypothetical protein